MNTLRPLRSSGLTILLVLAFAMAASGVWHGFALQTDPAIRLYVLAGGDRADICGGADGGGTAGHGDCPACHIPGAPGVPGAPVTLQDACLILVAAVTAPRESRAVRPVLDPARGMRAPPLA